MVLKSKPLDEPPVQNLTFNYSVEIKVSFLFGSLLLFAGLGFSYLYRDPEPVPEGTFSIVDGVITSGYNGFKADRFIIKYVARIPGPRGYPANRYFYAFENACGKNKMTAGDAVKLLVEQREKSQVVRQASTTNGCVLYDKKIRQHMEKKSEWMEYSLIYTMYGLSFIGFSRALYLSRKRTPGS